MLTDVHKIVNVVVTSCGQTEKHRMQQDVRSLEDGFSSLKNKLDTLLSSLELCLAQWCQFDKQVDEFEQWISQMKENLTDEQLKKPSLNEKKATVENLQV